MDHGEMGGVKNVAEIVVVAPYLTGRELALVHDIGRGKGAYVKASLETADCQLCPGLSDSHLVSSLFTKHVELP